MQLDNLNNQQNGAYQSLPEPISTAQMIYSPPEAQQHQGPYQQAAAQASHDNYTQAPTQQITGQLHPGTYQQPAAQLHQGSYQSQTVSTYIYFSNNFCLISLNVQFSVFSEITKCLFSFFGE